MSPLRTERLSVALCPTQVGIARRPGGWRRAAVEQALLELPPPAAGAPLWRPALDGLAGWLADAEPRRAAANLTLSNRFVRFAIVPWAAGTRDVDEEAALAAACFEARYGDMAGWTVSVDAGAYGQPRIACAVESGLLAEARALFDKHRLACRAVRPAWVAGWNRWRRALGKAGADGLLAMIESDTLVMATRRAGVWHSLRAVAAGADDLETLLEREVLLQGFAEAPPAWLLAPGLRSVASAPDEGLRLIGAGTAPTAPAAMLADEGFGA